MKHGKKNDSTEKSHDIPFEEMPPVEIPIDGTLDLHTFHPREVSSLVPEYLEQCRMAGIYEVRVIHGKGLGILRKSVHALLGRLDYVESWALAPAERGHWGATVVKLKPLHKT